MTRLNVPWHGLLDCATRPMSQAETESMMRLILGEEQHDPGRDRRVLEDLRQASGSAAPIVIAAMEDRGSLARVSVPLLLFVSYLCRTPGDAMLWAFTLHYLACLEDREVDFHVFADAFPMGIPTEEAKQQAWDAQKRRDEGRSSNGVNDPDFWPRLGDGKALPQPAYPPRDDHVAACKARALAVLEAGKADCIAESFTLMCKGLREHPETKEHLGIKLGLQMLMGGHLNGAGRMREFIEGFH